MIERSKLTVNCFQNYELYEIPINREFTTGLSPLILQDVYQGKVCYL